MVAVVVGLALGVGGVYLATTRDDRPSYRAEANDAAAFAVAPGASALADAAVDAADQAAVPAAAGAGSPEAAVEQLLQGEVDGDPAASFAVLSVADRTELGSVAQWRQAAARRARITGFRIDQSDAGADGVAVVTALELAPEVSPTLGIVPSRSTTTFLAVQEDGRWYVALDRRADQPQWPADTSAGDDLARWLADPTGCDDETFGRDVLGSPAVAAALCSDSPPPSVTSGPEPLPAPDAMAIVAAFGASAVDVVRVFDVDGALSFRAVLAPLGERWTVVAILAAT